MNYIIRPTREGDLPQILEVWELAFGDPDELSEAILRCCGLYSTALVAEADSRIVGCAFAFDGLELPAGRTSYLYAICVLPEHQGRGIGSGLTRSAARAAFERGAELVALYPADGLSRWYYGLCFRPGCGIAEEPIAPFEGELPAVEKISLEEYVSARGAFPSPALLQAQELIFRQDGTGAFYRVGDHVFCAENRWYSVRILDTDCPSELLPAAGAALAKHCKMGSAHTLCPGPAGEEDILMYLLPDGSPLPEPQGLFFPFTLN